MEIFKLREERQRDAANRILEVAGMAVADVIDRLADGEVPPFRVEIPPTPRGMRPRNYLESVQQRVGLTLDLREKDGIVCDEYHTSLVNARAVTGRANTNLFTRHYHNANPQLVFRELSPAERV